MNRRRIDARSLTRVLAVLLPGVVLLAALLRCDDVPSLTFMIGDAATEAADASDAQGDGSDGGFADADSTACVGPQPAGTNLCCGSIWCAGDGCDAHCSDCMKCTQSNGPICCSRATMGSALCRSTAASCP